MSSDASAYGLGGVAIQQDDESWKPVAYFSRALTNVEADYSHTEKECLGFTWVYECASDYNLGKPIMGETEHKPLLPMSTTHHLDQLLPRMPLMRFNIESMVHMHGKEVYGATVGAAV